MGAVTLLGTGGSPANAGTTTTAGTASVTPSFSFSVGKSTGDRIFVFQYGSNTSGATPSGWTVVFKDTIIGSGTAAAGSGMRYMSCYWRDFDNTWTMPAFTLTSATQNSHSAIACGLRRSVGTDQWDTPTFSSVALDFGTANTTHSATTASSFTTHTGGMLLLGTVYNDFVSNTSGTVTVTGTGTTLGTAKKMTSGGTSTGNTIGAETISIPVTTGGAGTISVSWVVNGATQGGTIVVEQSASAAVSSNTGQFFRMF